MKANVLTLSSWSSHADAWPGWASENPDCIGASNDTFCTVTWNEETIEYKDSRHNTTLDTLILASKEIHTFEFIK